MSNPNVEATIDQDIQELDDTDFLNLVKAEVHRRMDDDYYNLKTSTYYGCDARMLLALYTVLDYYD